MPGLSQWVAAKSQKDGQDQKRSKRPRKPERAQRLQDVIGQQLRTYYATLVEEPMPERLTELVRQLTDRKGRH